MAKVSGRVRGIEVSAIKRMPIIAAQYEGVIRLDQGIPNFPMPKFIRDYLSKAIRHDSDIGKYMQQPGMPALREAVAESLNRKYGIDVSYDEIFISTGSIEGLACTALTFLEAGDAAVLFSPAYEPHMQQVKLAQAQPVYVRLNEDSGWRPDIDALERALKENGDIRVIYACTPANPTGTVFTEQEICSILDLAEKHDALVVADEAYDFLSYENPHASFARHFPSKKKHLVVTKTWSKELAATGMRIGYVIADKEYLPELLKVHDALTISAPTPGQYMALYALQHTEETQKVVDSFRTRLHRRRDLMHERISGIPEMFGRCAVPEGAYYMFPRLAVDVPSQEFAETLIREARVSTVPGAPFGPGGEGHIRMMFGAPPKAINQAFDQLEDYVASKEFARYPDVGI